MRFRLIFLLGALLFSAGCGVSQVYYLQGNFNPVQSKGLRMDEVFLAKDVESIKGKTLKVQFVDPNKTIQKNISKVNRKLNQKDMDEIRHFFELNLADRMWQSRIFSDVCAADDVFQIKHPDLVMRVAVTRWHEGLWLLRTVFGFGLGATHVQWEGAIVDAKTNRVLFAFADARLHPGGPSLAGFGARGGGALIGEDLRYGADDLRRDLRKVTGVTEKVRPDKDWRPVTHPEPSVAKAKDSATLTDTAPQDSAQAQAPTLPASGPESEKK